MSPIHVAGSRYARALVLPQVYVNLTWRSDVVTKPGRYDLEKTSHAIRPCKTSWKHVMSSVVSESWQHLSHGDKV